MPLDRDRIRGALATVLAVVPAAEYRLVGTASSALRGIDLPASDVDILFRARAGVDGWFRALVDAGCEVETAARWEADANQYFARLIVDGVTVELSTVEFDTDSDTMECFGTGPWEHFDNVDVDAGGVSVPAVASELRLITELARGREDRYRPILEFLKVAGCDTGLVRRGLAYVGAAEESIERVVAQL